MCMCLCACVCLCFCVCVCVCACVSVCLCAHMLFSPCSCEVAQFTLVLSQDRKRVLSVGQCLWVPHCAESAQNPALSLVPCAFCRFRASLCPSVDHVVMATGWMIMKFVCRDLRYRNVSISACLMQGHIMEMRHSFQSFL